MTRGLRWGGAVTAVLVGAALVVAALAAVLAGHGWWALALALGTALVLWCGARLRPRKTEPRRDPRPPWDMTTSSTDVHLAVRLTGVGLGLFLTALLGFFGVMFIVFALCIRSTDLALIGLGLLSAGPLLLSASYVFIRR
jgi:hypothetical protein